MSFHACQSTEHEGGRYGRVKGKALKGCVSSTYVGQLEDEITKGIYKYRQSPCNDGLSRHSYTALNGKFEDVGKNKANAAYFESRESVVSIMTRLWAGRPGIRIPAWARDRYHPKMSRPTRWPTQPPIQWVSGSFTPGGKRLGRKADHSSPSYAEVKNEWSYTSTPTICFQDVARDNFTFRVTWLISKCFIGGLLKVKVKCTLVQALRLCTDRTAHRGSEV